MACLFYFPDFLTKQNHVGFGFLMFWSKVKTGTTSGEEKTVDSEMRVKLSSKDTEIKPSRMDTFSVDC